MSNTAGGGRQKFRTTIEVDPVDDGQWRAYEPASSGDLFGVGESPTEAVENYALALRSQQEAV